MLSSVPHRIIGVVVDADQPDVSKNWKRIKDKIQHHEYFFPDNSDPNGTILDHSGEHPRLGIWLMPNNKDSGMLEDFLMEMANLEAMAEAKFCVEYALKKGVTEFKDIHKSKAELHTYLAWRNEPGKPLGLSVTAHALQPKTITAQAFVDWLGRLFGRD